MFNYEGWFELNELELSTILDEKSPSGLAHLKISGREDMGTKLRQELKIDNTFDTSQMIEIRYWTKFDSLYNRDITEPYHKLNVGIRIIHVPFSDSKQRTTYLFCGGGCILTDNQWREFSATCEIDKMVRDDSNIEQIGKLIGAEIEIGSPGMGFDWYIDNVRVKYYERNRDWVAGANLRIEEFRTRPVNLVVSNATPGSTLHVEMIEVI